jgi:vacuolar-type H+-ATPase subunit H
MKARFVFPLLLLLLVSSCIIPSSKESYLSNFERFVRNVEKNAGKFSSRDWSWSNRRFSKYSHEWYDKFEQEFNLEEKIKVTELKSRYIAARTKRFAGKILNEELKKDMEKAGKEIKKYLDENLEEDIREISKGAKEIGDSAVKVMENILKEIKKEKKVPENQ